MRAAVYEGEGQLVLRDVPDPLPAPDEYRSARDGTNPATPGGTAMGTE